MSSTASRPIEYIPELVGPDYNLYRYRHDLYKVVKHKSNRLRLGPCRLDDQEEMEDQPPISEEMAAIGERRRLSQSLSRTRRTVLELALCNEWKWFVTLTISEYKASREDLAAYHSKFKDWLKYQAKKHDVKFRYLLVPELHSDGKSWHMHGFFGSEVDPLLVSFRQMDEEGYVGPDGKALPRTLIDRDYYNWPAYMDKFGFCSFGQIRNHDAASFYATKYISKSFQNEALKSGQNLYYASRGNLNRATHFDSVYGPCAPLDKCLTKDFQFCSTGFYWFQREPGDDPLLDILEENHALFEPFAAVPASDPDCEPVPASVPAVPPEEQEALEYYETMQELMARLAH